MKIKRLVRIPGKMLCGISFSLILVAAGQDVDPFGGGATPTKGKEDPLGSDDDFGGGGNAGSFDAGNDDPFSTNYNPRIFRKGKASEILKSQKEQVAVMIELIEVDHLTANEMMLKYSKQANDVGPMRKALIDMVKSGEATLVDTLWGRSPLIEMGKVEAIVEKIYPTEYEAPELPQFVVGGVTGKEESGSAQANVEVKGDLYTGATPCAFDTRNIGTTFEFEAAVSGDHPGKIGLSIFLQISKFLQEDRFVVEGQEADARGTANIVMPRFSNISQEFVATVTAGNHSLLGIYKDGADMTENMRVVILMHVEMIAKE